MNRSYKKRKSRSNDSEQNKNFKKNKIYNIKTLIPNTFEEAVNLKGSEKWKDAIRKELDNLYGNSVMKIVNNKTLTKDIKPLDVKWVFNIKDNSVYKARLVVRGFRHIKGVDYTNTYSPTVDIDSFDIKSSYLNAKLNEKIYVQIPMGDKNFNKGNPGYLKSISWSQTGWKTMVLRNFKFPKRKLV